MYNPRRHVSLALVASGSPPVFTDREAGEALIAAEGQTYLVGHVLIHGQTVSVRLPSGQSGQATVIRYSAGTATAHLNGTSAAFW